MQSALWATTPSKSELFMVPVDSSAPRIPGYSIKSIIGKGGFATVYLAQQHTLQRDVALKVMNPILVVDDDYCARFLREARDTALVSNHPNIVTIHDVGHFDMTYYIAMQYLPGATLEKRIESSIAAVSTSQLLISLASALSHIHQLGFVHRDIKPANILFTESGEAVLSDFGIARMDNRSTQLTHIGTILGTAKYMSPEQSRGDRGIDARSDLYSLGVVLFETLAQHPPFEASNQMALTRMHENDPVPRLSAKFAQYQPVVDRLMEKRVDRRYESAKALLDDLRTRFKHNGVSEHQVTSGVTSNSADRIKNNETQTSTVLAVASGVIFLFTGSLLFLYFQSPIVNSDISLECPSLTLTQEHDRDTLLELASVHQSIGRVTHPPGANALEAYALALDIDPCNQHIIDSMTQIQLAIQDAI